MNFRRSDAPHAGDPHDNTLGDNELWGAERSEGLGMWVANTSVRQCVSQSVRQSEPSGSY
jgi:hypothetical protein